MCPILSFRADSYNFCIPGTNGMNRSHAKIQISSQVNARIGMVQ